MGPDRGQAIALAALTAVPPILISILYIPLLSRAASGRLARNHWIGIRTRSTLSSDQAWMAGHRAALRLAPLYVLVTIATCAALLTAALRASTTSAVLNVGLGAAGVLVAVFLYSGVVASRAANSAGNFPDDRKKR